MEERDEESGRFVCDFVERLPTTDTGKPFRLYEWQRETLMEFYSTMERDEESGRLLRKYQYLYLEIPKKNGKSELSAALGLYHLFGDGELNAEVYLCAADKDNAGIVFRAAVFMLETAPWTAKMIARGELKVVRSQKRIEYRRRVKAENGGLRWVTVGLMQVLSSESYSKHGYKPSCVIFDELHAQPDRKLWDVMTGAAGAAHDQPVWIVLTTAGDDPDRHSIGWVFVVRGVAMRVGGVLGRFVAVGGVPREVLSLRRAEEDDLPRAQAALLERDESNWLPVLYGLTAMFGDDPDDLDRVDIWDEALWYRCNPSLGKHLTLRALRLEAQAAKKSPAAEKLFRWLRLNQWISVKAVGWLPLTLYDRTQWHVPRLDTMELKGPELRKRMRETLKGKKCFGGLDLSSTTDLSAFVLVFPPQPGLELWVTLFWAWRPRATVEAMEKKDHVPYRDWARAGYLDLCAGDQIEFEDIKSTILAAKRTYSIQALGVDPYLSREISGYLRDRGLNVIEIRQNMAEMSPPMKEIERLLRSGQMVHEHNTCARWCFGNVRCVVDGNENIRPMKNKSTGRIDITVAWIIAYAAAMLVPENPLADLVATGRWSL